MIFSPNIQAALRDAANNDVWQLVGSGAPVNGTSGTGVGLAGKNSTYNDYTNGAEYFNVGTKASPVWTLVSGLAVPQTVQVTLTNAQIKAIRATPVTLVAAPGAGKYIQPISCTVELVYGGTNAFTAAANDNLSLKWKDGSGGILWSGAVQAFVQATNSAFSPFVPGAAVGATLNQAKANVDNQPLVMHNQTAGEIAGNAAGDNTMRVNLHYSIQVSV